MDTDTRVDGYRTKNRSARLKPGQVRRSNHKMNGRKNHVHETGVRCQRCRPSPREAPKPQVQTHTGPAQRIRFPQFGLPGGAP
jgi:hypothetical protein